MNCAKAVHSAFLIFKRKIVMILEKQTKQERSKYAQKGVAHFRYIWYTICGSLEVII